MCVEMARAMWHILRGARLFLVAAVLTFAIHAGFRESGNIVLAQETIARKVGRQDAAERVTGKATVHFIASFGRSQKSQRRVIDAIGE